MTSGAFTEAFLNLVPEFERATKTTVVTAFGASMGGAPDSIPSRLARGEPVEVDYGHPELGPLLEWCMAETLGHVLYQDQVLQISCAVAGFTPGQADRLRRAMSRKRSAEAMQALAEEFYEGASRWGVSREAARVAFEKMAAFAAFGFPKSHAVAFALLAYESCWLRYHYPAAYYCSLFNAQPMGFYSVEVLTGDAHRHGIEVHAPSINLSRAKTWPEMDGVRLGLERGRRGETPPSSLLPPPSSALLPASSPSATRTAPTARSTTW